jgi:cobyrinic acid a,c-diamide synthase
MPYNHSHTTRSRRAYRELIALSLLGALLINQFFNLPAPVLGLARVRDDSQADDRLSVMLANM